MGFQEALNIHPFLFPPLNTGICQRTSNYIANQLRHLDSQARLYSLVFLTKQGYLNQCNYSIRPIMPITEMESFANECLFDNSQLCLLDYHLWTRSWDKEAVI